MAAKPDNQFARCVGKERFQTKAMADRVAKLSMQRREGSKRQGYKCDACGGYHVGSALVASGDRDYKREREQARIRDLDSGLEFAG